MLIKYYGHSCFTVSSNGYTVALDPYGNGSVPGLPALRLKANKVLCSHEHADHNCRDAVILEKTTDCPFTFSTVKSFHDNENGAKRGKNSIFILEAENLRIVHFGDLGCIPGDEQLKAIGHPDVVMIPVGGYYTIDAADAAKLVSRLGNIRTIIPMHYRTEHFGYGVLGGVDEFIKHFPSLPCFDCGSELDLSSVDEAGITIMSP